MKTDAAQILRNAARHNQNTQEKIMFTLSCESTVDLNLHYLNKRQIPAISYCYTVDGKDYPDDMRASNGLALFYNQLGSGKQPTTSLINVERYKEFFRPLLQKGDLLHLAFSSALSNSVVNALKAADELQEEFPQRKIYVVDTTCACVGFGMFVDCLADLRDEGKTIDELHRFALENRTKVHHIFYSTTLTYFRRSGRVSSAAALIGNILRICPVMHTDVNGKIIPIAKSISESKAVSRMLEEIGKSISDGADYCGKLWLGHSDYISSANKIAAQLRTAYPKADIRIFDIGPVIAAHCGPGTVFACYWGDERIPAK